MMEIERLLQPPERTFFLFGPRGVGKSTWLKHHFADAPRIDLLRSETFLELSRDPGKLEALIGPRPRGSWICVDEVQKVPSLLDEVHRLIEDRGWRFALSGSSARKLKRGGANLLGGRALTLNLAPFVSAELGARFDLAQHLEVGGLPLVVSAPKEAPALLSSYVHTYLKEEVREEGLVRRVEPFIRFLEVAGQLNGQLLNLENVAREARVPRSSIEAYFSILEDTLLGVRLRPFQPAAKVREVGHPKFYWFDPGVARAAAGLVHEASDSVWRGFALETWLLHELTVYNHISGKHRPIRFYRTSNSDQAEIDFVIETKKRTLSRKGSIVAIEAKLARTWDRRWEGAARSLRDTAKVGVSGMYGVYLGERRYTFDDFEVYPVNAFLEALHAGKIFE